MQTVPAFRLTAIDTAPPPNQLGLFTRRGEPHLSIAGGNALRMRVEQALIDARTPRFMRVGYFNHLLDGEPLNPTLAHWLGAPRRSARWEEAFAFLETFYDPVAARVRRRASRLVVSARAMRRWPRRAVKVLHWQSACNGGFDIATLPPLPSKLNDARWKLLPVALEVRDRLYDALAVPTRNQRRDAIHTVEVLRSFRAHFDFRERDIRIEHRQHSQWVDVSDGELNLLKPLPSERWYQAFAEQFRQTLLVAMWPTTNETLLQLAFDWLVGVVKHLAERSRVLDHVRCEIRKAYPCDRQVVADVHDCTIDLRPGDGLESKRYVWAWRHAHILRQRVRESRHLAAVWELALRRRQLRIIDDYDVLQRLLRDEGVTAFGWQLLSRRSRLLYLPVKGLVPHKEEIKAMCQHLRIVQRMQHNGPLPYALARALLSPHWFARDLNLDAVPLGLLRGAVEQFHARLSIDVDAFLEQEFIPVLGWLARANPRLDANQQRASWNWYLGRYREWSEYERRKREGRCWTHGIEGLHWKRFDVIPVRNAATLWKHGELMRTCLARYEDHCSKETYIVYSVENVTTRPYAHIGIKLLDDGNSELDQVAGFANAKVSQELWDFAVEVAGRHRD